MAETDLLAKPTNLLFERRGGVGTMYTQHIYLEKRSTENITNYFALHTYSFWSFHTFKTTSNGLLNCVAG